MIRNLLSIFTIAIFSVGLSAMNVNIPDANFKNYLILNTAINTNLDSEIQYSEAHAFTGTIDCQNLGISDLTGIEAFTALTELVCRLNDLSTLDLSQNTALVKLNCDQNELFTLDLSQNLAIQEVRCKTNEIEILNISQNAALTFLICGNNDLETLSFHPNTNLGYLECDNNGLTSLDVSTYPALTGLFCLNNNINTLDLSNNPALEGLRCEGNDLTSLNLKNVSPTTLTFFSAVGNPNLSCIEVDDVAAATAAWTLIDPASSFSTSCSQVVNIPDGNFKNYLVNNSSLNTNMDDEIQFSEAAVFTGDIDVTNKNISDLTGIEAFTALTYLKFQGNNVSTVDLSQNTALVTLFCNFNNFTTIDLSQNTALEKLYLNNNDFSSIDLSNNTALITLFCGDNPNLTDLDLSGNPNLITLHCEFWTTSSSLANIDFSQNINLKTILLAEAALTTVDVSQVAAVEFLDFQYNNLSAIDVSNNLNLKNLNIAHNNISELDLSQNTNLTGLSASSNNINSLDLSYNTLLTGLGCNQNNLTELNLKNIDPTNCNIYTINNPNLTCIEVDDATIAAAEWTNIDANSDFSENCSIAVSSITVQGQGGISTISTLGGTLQMEACHRHCK